MYDAACLSDPASLQRAVGALRVSFKCRDGETVLDGLRQEGCLKARFPRAEVPGWGGVVALNSSGGVAGGDRLVHQQHCGMPVISRHASTCSAQVAISQR